MKVLISFLLILSLSSCSTHKETNLSISDTDCAVNWGLCSIFKNQEYSIMKAQELKKIAILDSGIDDENGLLKGKVTRKYNAITKTSETKDNLGHGTSVASIIAAEENEYTIRGINPYVEIYDVKVIDDEGSGQIDHVVEGIRWSIENRVDIINISFGFSHDLRELKDIVDEAVKNDITIVASAGNNYGLSPDYPARYENVVSVGSINRSMVKSKFNSKGKIDVYAPGEEIVVMKNQGLVAVESGASLAAAYITGIISINHMWSIENIKRENNKLLKTGDLNNE